MSNFSSSGTSDCLIIKRLRWSSRLKMWKIPQWVTILLDFVPHWGIFQFYILIIASFFCVIISIWCINRCFDNLNLVQYVLSISKSSVWIHETTVWFHELSVWFSEITLIIWKCFLIFHTFLQVTFKFFLSFFFTFCGKKSQNLQLS